MSEFQVICGRDGVDPVVVGGAEQGQRAAVGTAGHPDPGVAVAVELHVVPVGEQVDQRGEVGDLEPRVVQPDLAGAATESARRVGEDDVAALGQVAGVVGDGVLAAPETVGEHHGRGATVTGREIQGRVELDRIGAGAGGHAGVLGPDVVRRGRCLRECQDTGEHRDGEQGGERRTGAGARAGTHEPAEGAHEAANGRRARHVPRGGRYRGGAVDQGCQSPARTTTRPGAATSAGSSKNRGVGPCSCGYASTSWSAA